MGCKASSVQRSDSHNMSESYWTKRRKLYSNVQEQLANFADSQLVTNLDPLDIINQNQSVVQVMPYTFVSNITASPDLLGQSAAREYCGYDSNDYSCDLPAEDDNEIRCGCDVVSSDSDTEDDEGDSIRNKLASWATKFSITLLSLTALLEILKPILPSLPKDARTLLGSYTQSFSVDVKNVSGGSYHYFGIENTILPLLKESTEAVNDFIDLHINKDGIPLFKSTNGQFWPVLGRVHAPFRSDPFVIELFYSNEKPKSLEFLTDFVEEYNALRSGGIHFLGKVINVRLSAIICDAPARAFVKNIKSHSGYPACERCMQRGEWNGKMTFPETKAKVRADEDFLSMCDEDHHLGPSPLSITGVGMVSHFVLDYMHLVCLGVEKRFISTWMHGRLCVRLGSFVLHVL